MILGIDPGMNGALSLVDEDGEVRAWHDIAGSVVGALRWLKGMLIYKPKGAVIENVICMPGQGVTAMRKYIGCHDALWAACIVLEIPILAEPMPNVWKPKVGIALNPPKRPGKGATDAERRAYQQAKSLYKRHMDTVSRDRAIMLFPKQADWFSLVKHTDRAEASLLGYYGLMLTRGQSTTWG